MFWFTKGTKSSENRTLSSSCLSYLCWKNSLRALTSIWQNTSVYTGLPWPLGKPRQYGGDCRISPLVKGWKQCGYRLDTAQAVCVREWKGSGTLWSISGVLRFLLHHNKSIRANFSSGKRVVPNCGRSKAAIPTLSPNGALPSKQTPCALITGSGVFLTTASTYLRGTDKEPG